MGFSSAILEQVFLQIQLHGLKLENKIFFLISPWKVLTSNSMKFGYRYTQVNLFLSEHKRNNIIVTFADFMLFRTIGQCIEYTENTLCQRDCNEAHKKAISMLVDWHRDGEIE